MFENDSYIESVIARYKLGLDRIQAQQFNKPFSFKPSWRDRFLFSLGKMLIAIGSRLQQRYVSATPAAYPPAYPAS